MGNSTTLSHLRRLAAERPIARLALKRVEMRGQPSTVLP